MGSLGIANVQVSDTPPSGINGYLWLDSNTGTFSVYYGPNNVWLGISTAGPPGFTGSAGSSPGFQGSAGITGGSTGYTGSIGYTGSTAYSLSVNPQSIVYTITPADIGNFIHTSANVVIPPAVLLQGQSTSVFNNGTANIYISSTGGVVSYLVGTSNTSTRLLIPKGFATIFAVNTNLNIITGGGLA
jgi:hypothetical protein